MRISRILAAVALAGLAPSINGLDRADAGYISGLYNTGTDASNVTVNGGSNNTTPDSHYLITSVLGTAPASQTSYVVNPNAYPLGSSPSWVADDAVGTRNGSMWISANGNITGSTNDPNGAYIYTTTFVDSSAAGSFLTGKLSADDQVTVLLNGHVELSTAAPSYGGFTNFTINNNDFVAGTNVLTFQVQNTANGPEGLRFQVNSASVPEPASLAMLGLGLAAVGLAASRRNRNQLHA